MNVSLAGKAAIITGGFSGIGLATVKQFIDSGAAVVAVDRAAQIPQSLKTLSADRLAFVQGDICQESTAIEFARLALSRFGKIDILINNAGTSVVKAIHDH